MTGRIGPRLAAAAALALVGAAAPALDLTAGSGAVHGCPGASGGVSFDAAAIAYVEPGPVSAVDSYGGGRYSPAGGNNIAVGVGFGEIAGDVSGYCIGVLYRADLLAEASRDLLDAVVGNHFGRQFNAGRTYRLEMDDRSFQASGARLRHVFDVDIAAGWSTRIGVGVSALKGLAARQQSIAGEATATSGTYALGEATWVKTETDYNLADFNPFVAPGAAHGLGFSTDFELLARSSGGYSVDFIAMDALGRIYWHDVPQSVQTLNNSAIRYNADFNRDAFVNGIDSRVGFTQDLPATYHLAVNIPAGTHLSAVLEDDLISRFHFPSVAARYGEDTRYGELSYDLRTRALGIGLRSSFVSAMLTANSFSPRNASVLGVSIQAMHAW